jgi:hypothetical protein
MGTVNYEKSAKYGSSDFIKNCSGLKSFYTAISRA